MHWRARAVRPLLCTSLLLMLTAGACSNKPAADQPFEKFWSAFRPAVLRSDADAIAALTRFPFRVKGTLDDDPVRRYSDREFRRLVPRLLQQDAGLSPQPEPMARYIERRADVQASGTSVRVGQFIFEKSKGKWAFVLAYMDDE